jgi:hypothetical protein
MRDALTQEQWNAFHALWSTAVGMPGYDKKKWLELERALLGGRRAPSKRLTTSGTS